jgi:hypothetical protein
MNVVAGYWNQRLSENCKVIYGAQQLRSKVLKKKLLTGWPYLGVRQGPDVTST